MPLSPSKIIYNLGIEVPEDIDIEAIAQYCNATIVYEPLVGCEARLIGYHDSAFITVNVRSPIPRRRFSAVHELGHWIHNRGKMVSFCTSNDLIAGWSSHSPEVRANSFAAELLMPTSMFSKMIEGRDITLLTSREMAELFNTSLTATTIRVVTLGSFPSMAIFSDNYSRKWFIRNSVLPDNLWPHERVDKHSFAGKLMSSKSVRALTGDLNAELWINHRDADDYVVHEESIKIWDKSILTILWWEDERQIVDLINTDSGGA